jgi:hypothetical protein
MSVGIGNWSSTELGRTYRQGNHAKTPLRLRRSGAWANSGAHPGKILPARWTANEADAGATGRDIAAIFGFGANGGEAISNSEQWPIGWWRVTRTPPFQPLLTIGLAGDDVEVIERGWGNEECGWWIIWDKTNLSHSLYGWGRKFFHCIIVEQGNLFNLIGIFNKNSNGK